MWTHLHLFLVEFWSHVGRKLCRRYQSKTKVEAFTVTNWNILKTQVLNMNEDSLHRQIISEIETHLVIMLCTAVVQKCKHCLLVEQWVVHHVIGKKNTLYLITFSHYSTYIWVSKATICTPLLSTCYCNKAQYQKKNMWTSPLCTQLFGHKQLPPHEKKKGGGAVINEPAYCILPS